ncbi:MAG: LptE family protein [Bacteroidales bacterium]
MKKWCLFTGIAVLLTFSHCKVNYSFTGASIPPEVKTIYIGYFENNASLVEPTLSQKITDAFRDKFASETSLVLVTSAGDMNLEGFIRDYRTQPVAIQTDDQAALNRLTITIEVSFENTVDEKMSFKSSFSRYADYSSSQNLSAVQEALIEEINTMLVEDVFNKAVVNW